MRENEQPSLLLVFMACSMAAASAVRAARTAASAALTAFFLPYQIRHHKADDDQQYAADDISCHTLSSYPERPPFNYAALASVLLMCGTDRDLFGRNSR